MKFLDAWARSYRSARALGAAIWLLIAIVAMLMVRCDPVVEREQALGLVVEIEAEGLKDPATGEPRTRVIVFTPDSTEVHMVLPPPVPKPGDFIPLRIERHRKGSADYLLEIERWRTEGSL